MSYFKPLNSNENNLHIIRATIDPLGNILYPTTNQLPTTFSVQYISQTETNPNQIQINYPGIFKSTDIPSVFIDSSVGDISTQPLLFVTSKTNTSCIISTNDFVSEIHTFDVFIVGVNPSGPVFAISNRGWKYSTNNVSDNILYSDMLIGINNDNPKFNLTTAGNIGYIPNIIDSTNVLSSSLLNYYLNIITISDASPVISLPQSVINGQFLQIVVGTVNNQTNNITLDISSNIYTQNTSNIVLQTQGDSLCLLSYNQKWQIVHQHIASTVNKNIVSYNDVSISNFNLPTILNGNLNVLNLDTTIEIDIPNDDKYNGLYLDLVVGSKQQDYYFNLLLGNIITSKPSLVLSNISDHVKLFKTSSKWLMVDYGIY